MNQQTLSDINTIGADQQSIRSPTSALLINSLAIPSGSDEKEMSPQQHAKSTPFSVPQNSDQKQKQRPMIQTKSLEGDSNQGLNGQQQMANNANVGYSTSDVQTINSSNNHQLQEENSVLKDQIEMLKKDLMKHQQVQASSEFSMLTAIMQMKDQIEQLGDKSKEKEAVAAEGTSK